MNTTITIRPQPPASAAADMAGANAPAQAPPAGNPSGFANTLHSVAPKPARKSSTPKEAGGTGVPPTGNDSPPTAAAQSAAAQAQGAAAQAQGAAAQTPPAAGPAPTKVQIDNSLTKSESLMANSGAGPAAPLPAAPSPAQVDPAVTAAPSDTTQPAGAPIAALMAQLSAVETETKVAGEPPTPVSAPPALATTPTALATSASAAGSAAAPVAAAPAIAPQASPADSPISAVKVPPASSVNEVATTQAASRAARTAPAHVESRSASATDSSLGNDSQAAQVSGDARPASADTVTTNPQMLTAPATPVTVNVAAATAAGDEDGGDGSPSLAGLAAPSQPKVAAAVPLAQDARPVTAAAHATEAQVVFNVADGGPTDKHASTTADAANAAAAGGPGSFNATLNHVGATDAPLYKVQAPVDSSDFGPGLAHQVSLMVNNSENSAKLQVNPPALGPIEVRIALQGDHAQIFMASHSAVTRDALQSSTPQLKEMLGSQGFAQVSVDISHRSFQERTPTAQNYERNSGSGAAPVASDAPTAVRSRSASAMLDAYA